MIEFKNILQETNNQVEKEYSKLTSLEHRKKFAQFFTPIQLASLMADWLLGNQNLKTVLEPAFGLGVFSRALICKKSDIFIKGFDIDEKIFSQAKELFTDTSIFDLHLEDYMFNDWNNKYDGIICNPPYFKFHDYENKSILNEIENRLNIRLNGFTNLYALFLLKSIYQLNSNGRLAYLIPSEFLNSDYGKLVKLVLIKNRILRHIIVFDFEENVFDDAVTTACILLCSNDNYQKVTFSTIKSIVELNLIKNYISQYPINNDNGFTFNNKDLEPDIKWRRYYQKQNGIKYKNLIPFSSVAKVVRGIATGANEFFTFTKSKADKFGIDEKYLIPCICKAIDVKNNFFTTDNYLSLVESDRHIFLLNAKGTKDKNVLSYIEHGEKLGINERFLTASRNPWFSIEKRPPSPIWVSVFNRSRLKFIRNEANILNLTTFHCVYLVQNNLFSNLNVDVLFAYLLTDVAMSIFEDNRREYGNGLQKYEPNDLNNAMMLDLSLLDKESENTIIDIYEKYKNNCVHQPSDNRYLNELNNIFLSKYFHP